MSVTVLSFSEKIFRKNRFFVKKLKILVFQLLARCVKIKRYWRFQTSRIDWLDTQKVISCLKSNDNFGWILMGQWSDSQKIQNSGYFTVIADSALRSEVIVIVCTWVELQAKMYLKRLQNMATHENRRRYDILKVSRKLEFLPFSNKITHTAKLQNVNRD